ncbi:MAG: response regulator transcription factor [Thiolinea sp.]
MINHMQQGLIPVQVVLVDDDAVTRFLIGSALREHFISVFECESAEALLELLEKQRVDVIILDLVLPQVNGLDALSYLRQHSDVGVIMISSCANQQQRLHGLREGADDFISKPVNTDELVFKVKSLAARVGHQHGQADRQLLAVGNCMLLADEHTIARADEKARFTLTDAEQRILVLLTQHSPQVCSRKSLLHGISRTEISMGNERSVDTLVGRIRRKLKQLDCTATVSSVRGQGYRLQIEEG